MNLVLGINTLTAVDSRIYRNHLSLAYQMGMMEVKFGYKTTLCAPYRLSVDHMRNYTAKVALEQEAAFIIFIDDDIAIPKDAIQTLLATAVTYGADVVSGLVFVRAFPFVPMIYESVPGTKDGTSFRSIIDYKDKADEHGIVECTGVGFSCTLLRVSTLLKVEKPYFMTGHTNTEDLYYCAKLYDNDFKPIILCNSTVKCKHIIEPESVSEENVEELRGRYMKKYKAEPADRGQEYHEEVMKNIQ